MLRTLFTVAVSALCLAVPAHALAQQSGRYVERVEVSRVVIDVRVVDASGQPIRDLDADRFTVEIDGKPARVESVQWITGDVPPVSDTVSTDPVTTPRHRHAPVVSSCSSYRRASIAPSDHASAA